MGNRFAEAEWRVVQISDQPIRTLSEAPPLPPGEIGELIVRGPQVTRRYVTREEQNALHKIRDGDSFWHRVGDVGYLDDRDRFWMCGRKGHRVQTGQGTMYTIPCEAIANQHPAIYRSALVGVGDLGQQTPVMICEPWPEHRPVADTNRRALIDEIGQRLRDHELTKSIRSEHVLLHDSLPVDIRHNSKIFREQLAVWAAEQVEPTR